MISSSSGPARPAACWRTGCRPTPATGCCCSRPAGAIAIPGSICRSATTGPSSTPRSPGATRPSRSRAATIGKIVWPRGKVLGGSSSINGLVYIRGQPEDFRHWRQLGNPGWDWDDVLPYFIKAEDQERGPDALHGTGGPLSVSDTKHPHPLCEAYIQACDEVGIPRNSDFNGASQEGAGYFQLTNRRGLRCSTAVAYLRPARKRPNLDIQTKALVSSLVFDGRRAVGRALPPERRRAACRREPRDRAGGGCDRLAADPAALRGRPGRAPEGARHRGGARSAGRRRQSAGSLPGPLGLSLQPADHLERSRPQPRPQAADGAGVAACTGPGRSRSAPATAPSSRAPGPSSRPRTCSSTSCCSAPTGRASPCTGSRASPRASASCGPKAAAR